MTVIPLPELGSELVVEESKESPPSNDTTARPFSAFVCSVGRLAAVDCDRLPLNVSPVAVSDQLARAPPLPTLVAKSSALRRTSGVTASGTVREGVAYRIDNACCDSKFTTAGC